MAMKILEDTCISCGAYEPACPTGAISEADVVYVIDSNVCVECVGYNDSPACIDSCPVECIIKA